MTPSDKSDAFRLGCYATAKHAGATHDEAVAFVADLDHRANANRAWRLGVYKTAKEAGATDGEAMEFVGVMEKRAVNISGLGSALSKGLGGLFRGIGNTAASFGQGMVGGPTRAMGPEQMKALQKVMAMKHGKVPVPKGSPKGTKPTRLSKADVRAQQDAHMKDLAGQGYAVPARGRAGKLGKPPALQTGLGADAVNLMRDNPALTGAGLTYGGYKVLGGGSAPAAPAAAAAGSPAGGQESYHDYLRRMDFLESRAGGGNYGRV